MNIRQHLISAGAPYVPEYDGTIKLTTNYCAPCMYKKADGHVVLEQNIQESVNIYKDAVDFIICELRSTIQHEAQHRAEEMDWHQEDPEQRSSFDEITRPSRAEVGPERAEEDCGPQPDPNEFVSGQTESTTIYDLFERAKAQSNIPAMWQNDVMAATLAEGVAGEYLMKSLSPEDMLSAETVAHGVYRYGNKLLIDVRKRVEPYIVQQASQPPTVQTQGDGAVVKDTDMVGTSGQADGTVPPVPSVGTVPVI